MNKIIGFFLAGPTAPAKLQLLLIAAAAVVVTCLLLLVWGLYWRGEARAGEAKLTAMTAQADVLAASTKACSAGVDLAAQTAAAALAQGALLLSLARGQSKDREAVAKSIDELARQKRGAGEGCDWAWDKLEKQRTEQPKARAAP